MKLKFKNLMKVFFAVILASNSQYLFAVDDEVDINFEPNYKLTKDAEKKVESNLSKFRGMGCMMVPNQECEDRIICYYTGSAHVNSKGFVAPKSFEVALKKTYRSAKMEIRKFISESGKSEDSCIDKVGSEVVDGEIAKERITSLCEEISSTSTEATLQGVTNVGYAFNGKNGQISAAVGMSCNSNQMAGRLKDNNLKTKSSTKKSTNKNNNQQTGGVEIEQGVESSEYFNEDF